ncbi:hypothetical protein JOF28_001392 [Leucobacter exalbidus]|uniref:T6SS immunity protein Tdi1 C-terminal domain-containing protein n=1 Tax=Leucobacter exalbidus TaxID=662960 RepID=A0A940T0S0_9MICO|nr:hypothetical protein [Leucobacter exalbidus]
MAIIYRENKIRGLGDMDVFLSLVRRGGARHLSRELKWDIFPKAVKKHGELPYDESFVYVPLLSLGGKEKVENLKKRETITSIQVVTDIQGLMGH